MKHTFTRVLACLLFVCVLTLPALAASETPSRNDPLPAAVPVPGTVTMLDLGAHSCIPCKMMTPILAELEEEYAGRAAILFIDVWQNEGEGKKYGITSIPTQIFFDQTGKEIFRHAGFYPKKRIVRVLDRLLAEQEGK